MENSTFLEAYLLTFVVCLILTIGLIVLINKGLKKYFENLCQDNDIANFFVKLTNIIILLGGLGAALSSGYKIGEDANWLTLTWDVTGQLENSLERLFLIMMIFAIAFFVLHLIAKRTNK